MIDAGHQPRRRVADLQIAAIALAGSMSLVTRNPTDFRGLEGLVDVVSV